jgi:hypothetical protein
MPQEPQKPKVSQPGSTTVSRKPEVITIPPRIVTREDKNPSAKRIISDSGKTLVQKK